jgi:hypothetical protein
VVPAVRVGGVDPLDQVQAVEADVVCVLVLRRREEDEQVDERGVRGRFERLVDPAPLAVGRGKRGPVAVEGAPAGRVVPRNQ